MVRALLAEGGIVEAAHRGCQPHPAVADDLDRFIGFELDKPEWTGADLPVIRSQVHLTSAAMNGLPSCHLTPSRSLKVSSEHNQIIEHAHHRSEHHNRRL